jgi:hypothetical protein
MPLEPLSVQEAAAWALLGGAIVESLDFANALRRAKTLPWKRRGEPGLLAYLVSVVLRVGVGAGLAAMAGADGQITGAAAAGFLGLTAPLLVEKVLRQVNAMPAESVVPAGLIPAPAPVDTRSSNAS